MNREISMETKTLETLHKERNELLALTRELLERRAAMQIETLRMSRDNGRETKSTDISFRHSL